MRDLILRDSFSERMNVEPHHDAVTCPGCLENILLVDARWPEGSDWQALLKVPQECALVCGGCHKIGAIAAQDCEGPPSEGTRTHGRTGCCTTCQGEGTAGLGCAC